MPKLTPQQFLDSTEFEFITCNSLHHSKPYRKYRKGTSYEWKTDSVFRPCRELAKQEYDSIDWTEFDCSKPLKRTKEVKSD